MKLYVRFQFSSEGASPIAVVKVMMELGFKPVMGEYDFYYQMEEPEDYRAMLRKVHDSLHGLNVLYTITTRKD